MKKKGDEKHRKEGVGLCLTINGRSGEKQPTKLVAERVDLIVGVGNTGTSKVAVRDERSLIDLNAFVLVLKGHEIRQSATRQNRVQNFHHLKPFVGLVDWHQNA